MKNNSAIPIKPGKEIPVNFIERIHNAIWKNSGYFTPRIWVTYAIVILIIIAVGFSAFELFKK